MSAGEEVWCVYVGGKLRAYFVTAREAATFEAGIDAALEWLYGTGRLVGSDPLPEITVRKEPLNKTA